MPVRFKIDTGAAVPALPSDMMKYCEGEVQPSNKVLKSAGNNKLKVVRQALVFLELKGKIAQEMVYFVEGLVMPLLGKLSIESLDIIRFVDSVGLWWLQ